MRPGKWELDRSHPLAQGLAFLSLLDEKAGRPVDAISNAVPTTFGATWGYDGITHSGTGKCAEWTLAPVASSDGYGLGDFTFFAMANPVAESTMRYLISQKNDALGAPYSQASLLINGAYAQANNSGRLAIGVYSGAARGAQAHISSLLDGFHHLLVGIRKGGVHSLYFDSNLLTNEAQSNVAADINRDGQFIAVGSQGGSTSNAFNRQIQFAGAYNRALSPAEIAILADRTDPMLGGLVREVNPVAYFDFGGASAGTDNLTATDLVTGSPVLGTPVFGQVHALTATGLTTTAPALGTPAVGQAHSLVASALVVGSPVLGTPSLSENAPDVDALTAVDLVVGSPVLGSPLITQIHTLEAMGMTVGVPVLGTPALNGSDIVLIDASDVGKNYRATLAKRNYTARL